MKAFLSCYRPTILLYVILQLFINVIWVQAQPSNRIHLVASEALNAVYNWEFDVAKAKTAEFKDLAPDHPAGPFMEALVIYWKHFPYQRESAAYFTELKLLESVVELADEAIARNEADYEAIFMKLSARSMIMRHYADFGHSLKAVGEAKRVYNLMTDGMDYQQDYPEFFFTSGIYNYYRVYYPENHPVYRPFAIFFKSGDKARGLSELKRAADQAIFTQAEAIFYLAYIYFRCEQAPETALGYYKKLVNRFPGNLYYRLSYVETLLLLQEYSLAADELMKLWDLKDALRPYYKVALLTYKGMLYELHEKKWDSAAENYKQVEYLLDRFNIDYYTEGIKTYVYAGLSNYYAVSGNQKMANAYLSKAKKVDEYGYLKAAR